MTNPFETQVSTFAKNFSIEYHQDSINIEAGETYRLVWPDQRWLVMEYKEDHSKTSASSDSESRQVISRQWVTAKTSGGPDWVNTEQLQVIGELINRKEQELHQGR